MEEKCYGIIKHFEDGKTWLVGRVYTEKDAKIAVEGIYENAKKSPMLYGDETYSYEEQKYDGACYVSGGSLVRDYDDYLYEINQ